jgi:hypothetical protein
MLRKMFTHPTIDRIAKIVGVVLGVFGFVISLFNLYFAYGWHQQALEDRVSVQLDALRYSGSVGRYRGSVGTLEAKVTNIGIRPIYLREVVLEMGKSPQSFYIGANERMKPLEPGEADDFKMGWNFTQNPVFYDQQSGFFRLANSEGKDEGAWVCILTTRALIRRPANIGDMKSQSLVLGEGEKRRPRAPTGLTATGVFEERSPNATQCP